jgi:hypothetical protein
MDPYVIVATKGRPKEVYGLLNALQRQSVQPLHTFIVGVADADVSGLDQHPSTLAGLVTVHTTGQAGSSLQRNAGVQIAQAKGMIGHRPSFVAFFDDDFRPATGWIEGARKQFAADPTVVGITGHVLADGVHGQSYTDETAQPYLDGTIPPNQHWASGDAIREMDCLYGCNMAFRTSAMMHCKFDERLPLYGWQEDQDYSSQIAQHGRLIYLPDCKGVHLGTSSGRTSGLRLGYSQIVNPVYLVRKGTMARKKATRFIIRHLIANTVKGLVRHPRIDYAGRWRGNMLALMDLGRGRCTPERIVEFK